MKGTSLVQLLERNGFVHFEQRPERLIFSDMNVGFSSFVDNRISKYEKKVVMNRNRLYRWLNPRYNATDTDKKNILLTVLNEYFTGVFHFEKHGDENENTFMASTDLVVEENKDIWMKGFTYKRDPLREEMVSIKCYNNSSNNTQRFKLNDAQNGKELEPEYFFAFISNKESVFEKREHLSMVVDNCVIDVSDYEMLYTDATYVYDRNEIEDDTWGPLTSQRYYCVDWNGFRKKQIVILKNKTSEKLFVHLGFDKIRTGVFADGDVQISFSEFPAIPANTHIKRSTQHECIICLKEYVKEDIVTLLGCEHLYHEECLRVWNQTVNNCPFCKQMVKRKRNYEIV